MSSGFSSSGSASNQSKEGTEDIQGSEYSTGGNHSTGMSSSGSVNNQTKSNCKNENDISEQRTTPTTVLKSTQVKK